MTLRMVSAWGEEHGMIKEVANSVADTGFGRFAEKDRVKMEKQRKEDGRMVWVRYVNYQGKHERLTAPYLKWAGDTIKTYHLIPNHEYYLPMGFVDQVNSNPGMPEREGKFDKNDKPLARDSGYNKIHEFILIAEPKKAAA